MKCLLISISIFLFSGPIIAQNNLKPYYFKLKDFKEARVYYLECLENPEESMYFYMVSEGKQLTTSVYIEEPVVEVERTVEVFEKKKARLSAIELYFPGQDETLEMEGEINPGANTVFSWHNDGNFGWWAILDGEIDMKIERKVLGKDRLKIMGKYKKCIRLQDQFSFQGSLPEPRIAYYVKGVGLAGLDIVVDGEQRTFRLSRIFSAAEWDEFTNP